MRYTIKKGDTLTGIARRFETSVNSIVRANGIKDPDKINVGDIIEIPTAVNYEKLWKQFEEVLNDIEQLPSFKILKKMM